MHRLNAERGGEAEEGEREKRWERQRGGKAAMGEDGEKGREEGQ